MKKSFKKNNKVNIYAFLLGICVLLITIGYAFFQEQLKIQGSILGNVTFNVHFMDAWVENQSRGTATINIENGADRVTYNVTLKYQGDKVLIGTKIKNDSSIRVKLNDFIASGISEDSPYEFDYIELDTTNEILEPGAICDYRFVVGWKENCSDVAPEGIEFSINLDYEQYTDNPIELYTTPIHSHGNFSLPEEYELCKYIEGTGSQYINSGLNAKDHPDIIVEIDGSYTKNNPKSEYIFGASYHADWETNNTFILMGCSNEAKFVMQNGIAGNEENLKASDSDRHTFILNTISNIGKIDQILQELNTSGIKSVDFNYVIFAQNSHGVVKNNASFKMYSCKIIENGDYLLNLIPCLDENKVPCMYDTVSNQCFYNSGSGTFNYGQ